MSVAWPDLVIGALLLICGLRGYKRGLIREIFGALGILGGIAAAFSYNGIWDRLVANPTRLGPGSAHVVALVLYAAFAYVVISLAGTMLGRLTKLKMVGAGNAVGGAALGVAKGGAVLWGILYVALFFPLSPDLRDDLHRSMLVAALQRPNANVDRTIRSSLPDFVKPYAGDLFERHHV